MSAMSCDRGEGATAQAGAPTGGLLILSEIRLYREGLARLTGQVLGSTVRTASSADAAMDLLLQEAAGVVLIDLALPDALITARGLFARFPEVKIVGLGVEDTQTQILACAEAGFVGFVSRAASTDDLVETIRGALSGELVCSRRVAGALAARVAQLAATTPALATGLSLTRREMQVLQLLDEGLSNKEIASRLFISTATARNHVHRILDRLGVPSRSRAAAVARRLLPRA